VSTEPPAKAAPPPAAAGNQGRREAKAHLAALAAKKATVSDLANDMLKKGDAVRRSALSSLDGRGATSHKIARLYVHFSFQTDR